MSLSCFTETFSALIGIKAEPMIEEMKGILIIWAVYQYMYVTIYIMLSRGSIKHTLHLVDALNIYSI